MTDQSMVAEQQCVVRVMTCATCCVLPIQVSWPGWPYAPGAGHRHGACLGSLDRQRGAMACMQAWAGMLRACVTNHPRWLAAWMYEHPVEMLKF